ncbi:MAG TPA: helix-turn-helix transcriptional regulator [Pseudonocardiaceae bacterium]|nr:helix-turn-helix transcriptional regulator [Pseudonocardiaceae bacterium]
MTLPTQLVLRVLLDDPTREMYSLEIAQATELTSGTTHQILARLEGIRWLESRFEQVDPAEAGRPRRRYYRLTPDGAEFAQTALARVHTPKRVAMRLQAGLAGGAA